MCIAPQVLYWDPVFAAVVAHYDSPEGRAVFDKDITAVWVKLTELGCSELGQVRF